MVTRAAVESWQPLRNPRMRPTEVSVALGLRTWENHAHGEGPQLIGSLVATLLDVKAWEALPMPAERERGVSPRGGRRVR
jgi:hypothetical protein